MIRTYNSFISCHGYRTVMFTHVYLQSMGLKWRLHINLFTCQDKQKNLSITNTQIKFGYLPATTYFGGSFWHNILRCWTQIRSQISTKLPKERYIYDHWITENTQNHLKIKLQLLMFKIMSLLQMFIHLPITILG